VQMTSGFEKKFGGGGGGGGGGGKSGYALDCWMVKGQWVIQKGNLSIIYMKGVLEGGGSQKSRPAIC